MHIQRIQVPDFRALKNVDISFEKEFTPRIFPLGSQNGGGKSTLLQLIFVLLHCSGNPDRVEFIQNLLDGFHVNDELGKRTLAIVDIWDGSKTVKLDFFVGNKTYILNLLEEDNDDIESFRTYDYFPGYVLHEPKLTLPNPKSPRAILSTTSEIKEEEYSEKMQAEQLQLNKKKQIFSMLDIMLNDSFFKRNSVPICNFIENKLNQKIIICRVDGIDINEVNNFLIDLSNKIFLTAHISQIFLFLQADNRKSLFKTQANNQINYYQQIKAANSKLPGFFTYDFLSIDILIEAFKKARDDDFKQAVEKGGNYGNNYVKLLDELNNLLNNKKINVQPDLSGINFKIDFKIDGDQTELYPEDLSHGELKRLCIYMWLKHNKIEDAIVLMDELEISFHPDWQYQIVRDLEEWGATNQYILATHSYELCNAVTPAHVKELDPKLQARKIK
ncbi:MULTISPECIES: AAA family ATPase [Nostocales]|jgi:predicted ATPase|uniref:AAA family ATPase n=1 Tax=Dolichospermum flos-aquae UHCC 0037 TaxID=2590026 RepID=A0ACC7S9F7_DOLFA|nr:MULTISPECIES: AAA family ATPase [Nostocales]MBO1064314.1 AAA family ATPase [Anabaena sp. 54]MCX5983398.1 AAA family ATPase [Nostocales cyanobacterium LacPavin_0920_SED1_MAG_38_18]MTJ45198.1 AAA family ATPase [Dolichospermum flos-aquae UHCC 0037]